MTGAGTPGMSRRRTLAVLGSLSAGTTLAGCLGAPSGTERAFSVVVLPDTQEYVESGNGIFDRQVRWLLDNRDRYGIETVLHLGDLVQQPDSAAEWTSATAAISRLDDAGVPTVVALGNHDATDLRQPTAFRRYLPTDRYARLEATTESVVGYGTFAGAPENAYLRQRVGGTESLFLTLEFGPRAAVVEWAEAVVAQHAELPVFLTTHSYLYTDGSRVARTDEHNPRAYGLTNTHNGVELWDALVAEHGNLVHVHSGHHIPAHTGRRLDTRADGSTVSQLFTNYQTAPRGGNGWLRLLGVDPADGRLRVRTYSPVLDRWDRSRSGQFTMPYTPPSG